MATQLSTSAKFLFAFLFGVAFTAAQPQNQSEPWQPVPGVRVFSNPSDPDVFVRVDHGAWSISRDAGKSATALPAPFPALEDVSVHFDPSEANSIFAVHQHTVLEMEGQSDAWKQLILPSALTCEGCRPVRFAVHDTGEPALLVAGASGLWSGKRRDDAVDWEHLLPLDAAVTALAISANHEKIAVATVSGTVYWKVEDEWSSQTPRTGAVSSLVFRQEPSAALYVGYGEPSLSGPADFVFASYDGHTFQSLQGDLPLAPIVQVFVKEAANEDPAELFAVLAHFVYRSVSDGIWTLEAELAAEGVPHLTRIEFGASAALLLSAGPDTQFRAASAACSISVAPVSVEVPNTGGSFETRISTSRPECRWTVARPSSNSAVTLLTSNSGNGSATVRFNMSANSGTSVRTVRLTVAGRAVTVTQRPASAQPCVIAAPSGLSFSPAGGSLTIAIVRTAACGTVSLRSNASWLTLSRTTASSSGQTLITVRAPDNSGVARTATVALSASSGSIPVATLTFSQVGRTICESLQLTMSKTQFAASGDSAILTLRSTGNCTAPVLRSSVTWLAISPFVNGSASVRVSGNAAAARSGQILVTSSPVPVSGAPLAFNQLAVAACTYSVTPGEIQFSSSGGWVLVSVSSSSPSCRWAVGTLATNAPEKSWLRPSATAGTGSGTVRLTADRANIQGRTATISIAGVNVFVKQAASIASNGCVCTSVACGANMQMGVAASLFSRSGGSGIITVNAPNSCEWNLIDTPSWIVFPDGVQGVGNGRVRFEVLPNLSGYTRTARITAPQATRDNLGRRAEAVITQNAR